jgi:hypothetical protein
MADTLCEHVAACGRWNNGRRAGWHTRWQALHELYRTYSSLIMHVSQCHAPCPGCARDGVACTLCRSVPLDGQGHGRLDKVCMPHRQRCSTGCREEAEAGKSLVVTRPSSRQAGMRNVNWHASHQAKCCYFILWSRAKGARPFNSSSATSGRWPRRPSLALLPLRQAVCQLLHRWQSTKSRCSRVDGAAR